MPRIIYYQPADRIAECPQCGEPIYFRYQREWQGEGAMGGFVLFWFDTVKDCDCPLTQTGIDDLEYEAKDCDDGWL